MGFFDRFAKKQDIQEHSSIIHSRFSHFKDAVVQSFSNIKKDIDAQKQWIGYLYNVHRWLQNAHNEHRKIAQKDLDNLKAWINHLYENSKKHEEALKAIEKSVNDAAITNRKYIDGLHNRINELISSEQKLKKEIMADVHGIVQERHDEARQLIDKKHAEVKQAIDEKNTEIRQMVDEKHEEAKKNISAISDKVDKMPHYRQPEQRDPSLLTNPEQKLLNILLAAPDPVSYTHVAEKTGNSINTVRVIMNNLKKRGLVEEHILPSGVKLFNAPNKEKIKKLYNIKHL